MASRGSRQVGYSLSPLHECVSSGKSDVLNYLLDTVKRKGQGKVTVNLDCKANHGGYTPLHYAASYGNTECARVLLVHGVDIMCTDDYGKTPKETAVLSGKHRIVKLLYSEGTCMFY